MFLTRKPMRGSEVTEVYVNAEALRAEFQDGRLEITPLPDIGAIELRPGGWVRVYADHGGSVPYMLQFRVPRQEAEDAFDRLRDIWEEACGTGPDAPLLAVTERTRFGYSRRPRVAELFEVQPRARALQLRHGTILLQDRVVALLRIYTNTGYGGERIVRLQPKRGALERAPQLICHRAVIDQRGCVLGRFRVFPHQGGLLMQFGEEEPVFFHRESGRVRIGARLGWLRPQHEGAELEMDQDIPVQLGVLILAVWGSWRQEFAIAKKQSVWLPREGVHAWVLSGPADRYVIRGLPAGLPALSHAVPLQRSKPRWNSLHWVIPFLGCVGVAMGTGLSPLGVDFVLAASAILGVGIHEDLQLRRLRWWVYIYLSLCVGFCVAFEGVATGLRAIGICLLCFFALLLLRWLRFALSPEAARRLRYAPAVGVGDLPVSLSAPPGQAVRD